MRFTIEEYAKAYSISPEMVLSRLRRNRLNYIIENDMTYIVVPKHQVPQNTVAPEPAKPAKKTTVATVLGLYQKENHYLKLKIEELEQKVDRLISEKEQLLKDERERIEKVYMDKDAQLKSILELLNTKMLQENKTSSSSIEIPMFQEDKSAHADLSIEANIEHNEGPSKKRPSEPIELKQYLRSLGLKSAQRKTIKRRFAEAFGADSRILLQNGSFYLDFDRFDYSDLLKLT